ncbi:MAG TPA: hypothetical protein VFP65_23820 [Anaeromyxobacteraceae bacterium]|nr:hypothetical protein [Anaeromyxobacteraceae bacterium]
MADALTLTLETDAMLDRLREAPSLEIGAPLNPGQRKLLRDLAERCRVAARIEESNGIRHEDPPREVQRAAEHLASIYGRSSVEWRGGRWIVNGLTDDVVRETLAYDALGSITTTEEN